MKIVVAMSNEKTDHQSETEADSTIVFYDTIDGLTENLNNLPLSPPSQHIVDINQTANVSENSEEMALINRVPTSSSPPQSNYIPIQQSSIDIPALSQTSVCMFCCCNASDDVQITGSRISSISPPRPVQLFRNFHHHDSDGNYHAHCLNTYLKKEIMEHKEKGEELVKCPICRDPLSLYVRMFKHRMYACDADILDAMMMKDVTLVEKALAELAKSGLFNRVITFYAVLVACNLDTPTMIQYLDLDRGTLDIELGKSVCRFMGLREQTIDQLFSNKNQSLKTKSSRTTEKNFHKQKSKDSNPIAQTMHHKSLGRQRNSERSMSVGTNRNPVKKWFRKVYAKFFSRPTRNSSAIQQTVSAGLAFSQP